VAFDPEAVRLGKKPGVVRDRRTLQAARYIEWATLLPKAPARVQHTRGLSWGMLGNDDYGDCTFAGAVHLDHGVDRKPEPDAQAVVRAYLDFTHGADEGAYLLDVLNLWRREGIVGETITAFAQVRPTDREMLHVACWLFGGLYAGLGLPVTAQGQRVWDLAGDPNADPDARPYSWGGHCVYIPNSTYSGGDGPLTCVTWGGTVRMTWDFVRTYMDECYAVIHPDWLARRRGRSPQGFSEEQLLSDLDLVTRG
jgi:hypothetical protein